jgi:hypothetical protein
MYSTENDLPEGSRRTICEMLNSRLAEAIDIGLQVKQGSLERQRIVVLRSAQTLRRDRGRGSRARG